MRNSLSYFDVQNLWKLDVVLLQVEAWDQDCSPQYSQICNYEIVTAGTPFAIDRNGKRVHLCACWKLAQLQEEIWRSL